MHMNFGVHYAAVISAIYNLKMLLADW
uniref:Uncharacterized protein n=1 Tax=Arundo donax TaxID=35708 RepID=A0A0A9AYE8_ARUDO